MDSALSTVDVGDIVRPTRKAADLRKDELADASGVGLRFIVDLEAGKQTAQFGKTLQVLAALVSSTDRAPPPAPDGTTKKDVRPVGLVGRAIGG